MNPNDLCLLNQDIVASPQDKKCELKYDMWISGERSGVHILTIILWSKQEKAKAVANHICIRRHLLPV